MNKSKIALVLKEYFIEKGRVLSYEEYRDATDAPIRLALVKRALGGWNRVLATVGDIPVKQTPEPVVSAKETPKPVAPVQEKKSGS